MFNCCKSLVDCIERHEFKFYPQFRGVCYYFWDELGNRYGQYFIKYCPFCGAKLPSHLYASEAYEDALEEALKKDFCDITEDEIPEEFKTDEWWKKRGL